MPAIEANQITFRYGRGEPALEEVSFTVPDGAFYALVGPNGAGKTTLMQILRGLRRPSSGEIRILGNDPLRLTTTAKAEIGYVAEGLSLPPTMRLGELERYLAPLYPCWDANFVDDLRRRFRLDSGRRIRDMSRGERMKSAILCALAPRPRLLLLDEPFAGLDVIVKDELIRGLLDSAAAEKWTAVICSHDISELEMLCDWLGVLASGQLKLSAPLDEVRNRFVRVDASLHEGAALDPVAVPGGRASVPTRETERSTTIDPLARAWLTFETGRGRIGGIMDIGTGETDSEERVRAAIPAATRVDIRPATLREIITATVAADYRATSREEIAA